MGFRVKEFNATQFEHRTEAVLVPALGNWFDGLPEWRVRGLTAHEFAHCNEAASRDDIAVAVLDAFAAKGHASKVRELRSALGLTDEVPGEVRKRIEMLTIASVDPICDRELAVKIAERFAIEFYQITNRIVELTGRGQVSPGKSAPSGETEKSAPA